jgi:hypothetical protein
MKTKILVTRRLPSKAMELLEKNFKVDCNPYNWVLTGTTAVLTMACFWLWPDASWRATSTPGRESTWVGAPFCF